MKTTERIGQVFKSGWESIAYWGLMGAIATANLIGNNEIDLQEMAVVLGFGYLISVVSRLYDGIQIDFHQKIDVTEKCYTKTKVEIEDETE